MADEFKRMRQLVSSTAEWAAHDIVIGDGEIAVERVSATEIKIKVGDGVRRFSALPYASGSTVANLPLTGGTLTGALNLPAGVVPTANNAVSRAEGDKLYVNVTGDTMTGPLLLPPTVPTGQQAVSRDQGDALYLPKAGGTMTGALTGTTATFTGAGSFGGAVTLPNTTPTGNQAVSRVQGDKLYLPVAGGTLTGGLIGTTAAFSGAVTGASGSFTGTGSFGGAVTLPVGVPTGNQAVSRAEGDKLYVNTAGDTMTGALVLPAGTPTGRQALSLEEADKLYTRASTVAGGMTFRGAADIKVAVPSVPATPARGDYWVASTDGVAHTSWTGIAGQTIRKGDLILYDGAAWHAIAQEADLTKYLPLTGGTLTGALTGTTATFSGVVTLPAGTPTSNQALSRNAGDALYLHQSGGTLTGALTLPAGAPSGRQALSKEEADKLYLTVGVSGGMAFKGTIDVTAAAPTSPHAGDYYAALADGTLHTSWTGVTGAVKKGDLLLYDGTNWHAIAQEFDLRSYLPLSGGTLTGQINLPAGTPTSNQAVSRTAGDALYLHQTGGTLTGALTLPVGAPTGRQAISKEEADKLYAAKGAAGAAASAGGLSFKGSRDVTVAAPTGAKAGDYYAASKAGTIHASWTGLTGAINLGDLVLFDGTNWHTLTQDADLTKYLPLTGGTLTGALHGTTLTLSGGVTAAASTFTGAVTLPTGTPTGNQAVSRTQGDTLYLSHTGGTLTGALAGTTASFSGAVTLPAGTPTGTQAVSRAAGDALYLTQANAATTYLTQANAATTYLAKAGGTLTGALTLAAAPTADLQAATKKYVDDAKAAVKTQADTDYVNVSGDTMTGNLTLQSNLILDGNSRKILGNFGDATVANRVAFQNATVGDTSVTAIPNGTGWGGFYAAAGAIDNSHYISISAGDDGGAKLTRLSSGKQGTAPFTPLRISVGGHDKVHVGVDGKMGVGTLAPPSLLTSNESVQALGGYFLGKDASVTDAFAALSTRPNTSNSGAVIVRDSFGTYNPNGVEIFAGGSERIRVLTGGNVGVGVINPLSTFHVNGTLRAGGASHSVVVYEQGAGIAVEGVGNASAADKKDIFLAPYGGNVTVGYAATQGAGYKLQVNGTIFATSNTIATSDARYKENVVDITGALDVVKALRPVQFEWKDHAVHNFDRSTPTVGFLAQDVQRVLAGKPYVGAIVKTNECTLTDAVLDADGNEVTQAVKEDFLGLAEGNLISILTAAIKEQQALIESLTARITALEARP